MARLKQVRGESTAKRVPASIPDESGLGRGSVMMVMGPRCSHDSGRNFRSRHGLVVSAYRPGKRPGQAIFPPRRLMSGPFSLQRGPDGGFAHLQGDTLRSGQADRAAGFFLSAPLETGEPNHLLLPPGTCPGSRHLSANKSMRQTFSGFRATLNNALAPREVDHTEPQQAHLGFCLTVDQQLLSLNLPFMGG